MLDEDSSWSRGQMRALCGLDSSTYLLLAVAHSVGANSGSPVYRVTGPTIPTTTSFIIPSSESASPASSASASPASSTSASPASS
ncbi:hypothetical protein THAOC_27577, partial [Thalassiosira oceanica]